MVVDYSAQDSTFASHPELDLVAPESASAVLDFNDLLRDNPDSLYIDGTAVDLIRDAHDHPAKWLHNGCAQPDDRRKAFLVGRGWSRTPEKLQAIADAGIPWMAINEYPLDGPKPQFWCSGDPPVYFNEQMWEDPDIAKFCGMNTIDSPLSRPDAYHPLVKSVEMPNVHYFHAVQNSTEPESWLHTPWLNWGTSVCSQTVPQFHKASARSSMLIGLRLLWHLGFREVYLLGCDCTPHHHDFKYYYETIFHHVEQIKPTFDRFHYSVHQTNFASHLRVFDFVKFGEALKQTT